MGATARRGSGGGAEAELLHRLRVRLGRPPPGERPPGRAALAAFMFAGSFAIIALLALVAMVSRTPFVFPSLGPTAFVVLFRPTSTAASPRHCVLGHLVGLACGYGALLVTGLAHAGPTIEVGVSVARVLAAGLAMGATGALMILLRIVHPPAGATTLIVALGIVARLEYLVVIEVAVVLLVALALGIHRFANVDYLVWRSAQEGGSGDHT